MYTLGRYFSLLCLQCMLNYNCRVLWGAMLGMVKSKQGLVEFAIKKLLGGEYLVYNAVPDNDKQSAAIAILASRCALNISPV